MIPELRALFADDDADGRELSVALPAGRAVVSDEDDDSDRPAFWLSDAPVAPGLWARLRAEHARSGLWPLLLQALDDADEAFRPWGNGEVCPADMTDPGRFDADVLLAQWWRQHTTIIDTDPLAPTDRLAITAPYGDRWPGQPAPRAARTDPDLAADDLASQLPLITGPMRLGLVAAERGADTLTVAGWIGPYNYVNDTAETSAVLRDWEHRFGARVVGVGFSTLTLSVAAPPTTEAAALRVAAAHFAFCPDNIWQGRQPFTLAGYAEHLVNSDSWTFWWD